MVQRPKDARAVLINPTGSSASSTSEESSTPAIPEAITEGSITMGKFPEATGCIAISASLTSLLKAA